MRLAKQLQKKIDACDDPDEKAQLLQQFHVAQVDEAYALHHPHAEPYVSLYTKAKPSPKDEGGDDEQPVAAKAVPVDERPEMWSVVEKAMEEGPEALRRLRERRSPNDEADASSKSRQRRPLPAKQQPRASREQQQTQKSQKPAPSQQKQKQDAGRHASTSQASTGKGLTKEKAPQLNRRERRRLQHQHEQAMQQSDEDDGEGFFDM